ncbi:MAG: ribosome silencing factor [Alphaproteobacteria bacterium]
MLALITDRLHEGLAEDVTVIDLHGKTAIADYMVIASGRSQRQIGALAENLIQIVKHAGLGPPGVEGLARCEWVLLDAGDVIVHLFRPETRSFYNLEKMWTVTLPESAAEAGKDAVVGV